MEESTAIWLLGLAHAQCEALQIECAEVRSHLSVERDRLRAECDKLRDAHRAMLEERIALRTARDDAGAERDALRAELDALKASTAPTGWFRVGDWAYVHPDGRAVRLSPKGYWYADDFAERWAGSTAAEVARAAGWTDFPGVTEP